MLGKILLGIVVMEVLLAMKGKDLFITWNQAFAILLSLLLFFIIVIGIIVTSIYVIATRHYPF